MKKHLVTLFVFLYIAAFLLTTFAGVVTKAEELKSTNPTDDTTLPQTESSAEEGISAPTEPEILPPSALEPQNPEWLSYWEFDSEQNRLAYAEPSVFVGCVARFDIYTWGNFKYAVDPANVTPDDENDVFDDLTQLTDESGNGIPIRVVDYAMDSDDRLWYKIEAMEGYPLPQILIDCPYILHLEHEEDYASLLWQGLKGMFIGETVNIQKQAEGAAKFETLNVADLPTFFDVTPYDNEYGNWYDLGDITAWSEILTEEYRYVSDSSVLLISPAVTKAYESLTGARSAAEFEELWANIPEILKEYFVPGHLESIIHHQSSLHSVRYEANVMMDGISVPVTVTGPIPTTGITLSVTPVTAEQVLAEGFDIEKASDVITALDIKLLKEDNTEWQPEDGQQITVTIGMAELGIADETVVSLHHKHGDDIRKLDIFLVLDGKVTVITSGLSIFSVQRVGSTEQYGVVNTTGNNGTITLTVGQPVILYDNNGNANNACSWTVIDTTGALHYTVHGNNMNPGNRALSVPWIQIVPLRVGSNITLTFNRQNYSETFTVNIVAPKAAKGQTVLYLKDDVNLSGRLIATLVDENGNEQSLAGAVFSWSRNDNILITPHSYGNMVVDGMTINNISVDIARDHGGLKEASMNDAKTAYDPTIYTCVATLPDGTQKTATYTVYYQSEFINSGFEFPNGTNNDYNFFPNGYPELYWKTTGQATGNNIGKDIEYRDVSNVNFGGSDDSAFGVERAADEKNGGTQFAELNAEAIGALYQDIITAPGEDIEWKFSHAPRRQQSWTTGTFANKMFVVIGATEEAQKLTSQTDLMRVCNKAKDQNITDEDTAQPVVVTMDNGAVFHVWYHDAGAPLQIGYGQGRPNNNYADNIYDYATEDGSYYYGWTQLSGSYNVPPGQYRTRLFFVSDSEGNDNVNYGNLIDVAKAGQYKTFLIEYYEETFEAGSTTATLVHIKEHDESGEALIYSSELLENLNHFLAGKDEGGEGDFLHRILINGSNYPYTLRYLDTTGENPVERAYLYIEKYQGTAKHFTVANKDPNNTTYYDPNYKDNDYSQYDIVMQLTLRDTVVAVQKVIEFPETLTTEQKLKIINDLQGSGGYKADFELAAVDSTDKTAKPLGDEKQPLDRTGSAIITQRDPKGQYTGYISLGRNPSLGEDPTVGQPYTVTETSTTSIPGLQLCRVVFATTMYQYGADQTPIPTEYTEQHIITDTPVPLTSTPFVMKQSQKIADIVVTNYYKEKMTKVYYEAVGKGKVQLTTGGNFEDKPMEELAFYSGKAVGAVASPGKNATFKGWFTDPECKNPVTAAHGVYDNASKTFVPNTNIIEADEVTFYALFETGSIIIERTNGEPNETFVYEVTRSYGAIEETFYVTVTCDGSGSGSRQIQEIGPGTYTVKELGDWTWRHDGSSPSYNHNGTETKTFSFTSGVSEHDSYWLSGWSSLWTNVFKKNLETKPEDTQ